MDRRIKHKSEGRLNYYPESDVLHYVLKPGEEFGSREITAGVTLELDRRGQIIGIEILNASEYMRSFVLEHYREPAAQASK